MLRTSQRQKRRQTYTEQASSKRPGRQILWNVGPITQNRNNKEQTNPSRKTDPEKELQIPCGQNYKNKPKQINDLDTKTTRRVNHNTAKSQRTKNPTGEQLLIKGEVNPSQIRDNHNSQTQQRVRNAPNIAAKPSTAQKTLTKIRRPRTHNAEFFYYYLV